jgi:hypothetical protein
MRRQDSAPRAMWDAPGVLWLRSAAGMAVGGGMGVALGGVLSPALAVALGVVGATAGSTWCAQPWASGSGAPPRAGRAGAPVRIWDAPAILWLRSSAGMAGGGAIGAALGSVAGPWIAVTLGGAGMVTGATVAARPWAALASPRRPDAGAPRP